MGSVCCCFSYPRSERIFFLYLVLSLLWTLPKKGPFSPIRTRQRLRSLEAKPVQLYHQNLHRDSIQLTLLIDHIRLFMDRLCNAFVIAIFLVLDAVQFIIASHERGSHYSDFQSGRTVTEIEKPIPRIQMQGMILQGRLSMVPHSVFTFLFFV